ncbi:MAG: hypothetical protein A2622_14330 [Bdellovibrionales bacterium RIFCSPHIGHO2_01_FULL_40_29]|nr:MAG: hypothetical protein A2622_14330 [Bdellovibrionales bacterium RIFCSPHIGHO2_01_FULL_40_29]OFZ33696.1 MAG: hypothetical protein A3D17_11940 [Bdellovibrionales bacterium RIFCSPHIGHO2_02_FULL_40_15]
MSSKALKVHTQGKIGNPVLVFLHAFPFSGEMWKDQINLFSEKFYCVAPDLPDFGESDPSDQAVTFEYYVDSVLNYLKEEKIEKAIWCGLSMGGYLALRMFERAPDNCRALILCDTKAGADSNEAKLKRWDNIQILKRNRAEFIGIQWHALVGESSKNNGPLKTRFEELISRVTDTGIISGLVALATRTDCTPGLSKIHVPVLILVGEEDKVTPVSESEIMTKAIVGSQLKIIAKTGHLSNLENPQKFNDHLSDFLTSLS